LFFLNLGTADPTINGKIFSLAETATFFTDRALRLLTLSIVRKLCRVGASRDDFFIQLVEAEPR